MTAPTIARLLPLVLLGTTLCARGGPAEPGRKTLSGHVPAVVSGLRPIGRPAGSTNLALAIGLPLRNQGQLTELLGQLQDPRSTNYHKYLTPQEFAGRFGPTEAQYEAVISFVESHGLRITERHSNHVVLGVEGRAADIERAFRITLRVYRHPTEGRDFFAPDTEPSVPADLAVADMWGLTDYYRPIPLLHPVGSPAGGPVPLSGSAPSGYYQGRDFRNAYAPGALQIGSGQTAAVAEFDGYYANDITTYENNCGYTNVPLQNVLLDGVSGTPGYSGIANAVAEVSLDIELIIAMAPGLNKVIVYEGSNPYNVFNRIVTDNVAKQISCSWAWGTGPNSNWGGGKPGSKTLDSQLQQMGAQGQSFFEASGDSDAYTGSQALSSSKGPIPVDSVYVTSVGGTTLSMNGSGASWSSETVWNRGGNIGTGGGVSPNYPIPSWQTAVDMSSNNGSTANRNIPDVAMTAESVWVVYNNGSSNAFGGTSCAAPLWAGFTALVNQQLAGSGSAVAGFLNPALYTICTGTNYAACFHDTTTGNNIGTHTPGLYNAVPGYDLCTGWGTPNGTNLINALAPRPCILAPPTNQTAASGNNAAFRVTAGGQPPFSYQWRMNGTNLASGGNVSGVTSSLLSIASVTAANAGSYRVVVTNLYGSITSSAATLTVQTLPTITVPPAAQTVQCGSNAAFSVTATGATPLSYQWRLDGAAVSAATGTSLTLTNVHLPNHTVAVVVTNIYGGVTSSAALTVQDTLAPVVTLNGGNPFYVELGGTFTDPGATASDLCAGAVPVTPSGGVNTIVLGTNTVLYTATDGNGNTGTASRAVIVRDTTPPTILWSFTNLALAAGTNCNATMPDVTGTNYILATDLSGTLTITQSPLKNAVLALGTNVVVIAVADSSGNVSRSTNRIAVLDQTPPVILAQPHSQTNGVGGSASFSVTASACTALAYQWSFNSSALAAQTNNTLTLTNLASSAAGSYSVVARAAGGSTTSAVAVLTVLLPVISSVTESTNGSVTVTLSGAAGATYILETATDLFPAGWRPLATNTLDPSGLWQFTDGQATNSPHGFYRFELKQ